MLISKLVSLPLPLPSLLGIHGQGCCCPPPCPPTLPFLSLSPMYSIGGLCGGLCPCNLGVRFAGCCQAMKGLKTLNKRLGMHRMPRLISPSSHPMFLSAFQGESRLAPDLDVLVLQGHYLPPEGYAASPGWNDATSTLGTWYPRSSEMQPIWSFHVQFTRCRQFPPRCLDGFLWHMAWKFPQNTTFGFLVCGSCKSPEVINISATVSAAWLSTRPHR